MDAFQAAFEVSGDGAACHAPFNQAPSSAVCTAPCMHVIFRLPQRSANAPTPPTE
ncbi:MULTISPECIES: hypothetical protein [Kingella]|uniref:Uncharacterized protein n=2 Tax=Kingella TaxID=32257 RepID=C4GJN5_9NEIS|nr:hypothetical protein [Kingella bonacorsii]EEP68007.1 hypothetical protein GCWU000324_02258 [Kingella oralis ATCC 51147]MBK0396910.1 hypothetical protein [Kingella bonacorsii]